MLSDKVYPTKDEIGWIFKKNNEQYWDFKNTGVVKYFYNKKIPVLKFKTGHFYSIHAASKTLN